MVQADITVSDEPVVEVYHVRIIPRRHGADGVPGFLSDILCENMNERYKAFDKTEVSTYNFQRKLVEYRTWKARLVLK